MRYGTQITGDKTSKHNARAEAESLMLQDGCIRAGTKWEPEDFDCPEHSAGRDHYAYGVFADDTGTGPLPDNTRRVVLVGSDLRRAEEIDAFRARKAGVTA